FAVVADEVRNLASKSAEASKNTAVLIENSLHAVENGKRIADETAKSLEQVMTGIADATSMMDSIAKASKEQAEAITQITIGIDQISSVVQTNSATAEESAAASEELSGQAQILKELVKKFRLEGQSNVSVMPEVPQYEPSQEDENYVDLSSYTTYGGNDKY
ncbi:MAG: methyl-accepting chemotaxis protein, partial [Lachnospiraceae bacterium]|nr:methyl-accepting chemotaxis protein [Lachnospiraceae bacterium]